MPIDNGFSSRRTLVQKSNPNHGKDGRFASAPGARQGGTVGAPRSDAFGNPLKGPFKAGTYGATQRNLDAGKQTAAAHSQRAQYVASHVHGQSDEGYGPDKIDPAKAQAFWDSLSPVQRKQLVTDMQPPPKFHIENPAGSGGQFSKEQMARNYQIMHGKPKFKKPPTGFEAPRLGFPANPLAPPKKKKHPGSLNTVGQPTKRSSFS